LQAVVWALCLIALPAVALPTAESNSAGRPNDQQDVAGGLPAFSGERAMAWLTYQCELGPRFPGSPGIQARRDRIAAHADSLGLRFAQLCFTTTDPLGGAAVELCNLIISADPADRQPVGAERLWIGAHYDTRPICDHDPDPARRDTPLSGANDGASGTAILLHLAELLVEQPPARGVDLIFFDGEDSGRGGDVAGFCLGSKHLAATWQDFSCPLAIGRPSALLILDMVGEKNLLIRQERYSARYADTLLQQVFDRAAQLGLTAFRNEPGPAVYDDHVPFLQAGIPAIDLIDFDFPQWHTSADTPAICSPASLEQVGVLVTDIIYRPLAAH